MNDKEKLKKKLKNSVLQIRIVTQSLPANFEDCSNEFLYDGWELYGEPKIQQRSSSDSTIYFQMLKKLIPKDELDG